MWDLTITNQVKDEFIKRLDKERAVLLERLIGNSHRIGELETRLFQLEAPKESAYRPEPDSPRDERARISAETEQFNS